MLVGDQRIRKKPPAWTADQAPRSAGAPPKLFLIYRGRGDGHCDQRHRSSVRV